MFTIVALLVIMILIIIWIWTDAPEHLCQSHQLPVRSYDDYRTGDILVLYNSGWIARMIRAYERTPATHTAMIVTDPTGIYALELDLHTLWGSDVRVIPINEFLNKQGDIMGVIPYTGPDIGLDLATAMNLRSHFDLSLSILPNWVRGDRQVCSEFIYDVAARYDIQPWNNLPKSLITPHNYHIDPSIEFYSIKDGSS